jgi:tRNA threonylcarbamoyladenosine biosynthesis protein TsaB
MNPVILAIDTSTTNIVVGICRGEEILCDETLACDQHQSKHLLTFIDNCLKMTKLKLQDVDAFATTTGPGSFTGVRICLGTMKALAFSLNKPLIGIPTLHAMAATCDPSKTIIVTLSARKGYVYSATYQQRNEAWIEIAQAKMVFY